MNTACTTVTEASLETAYHVSAGERLSDPTKETDELIGMIYSELRALARVYLRRERADHTLQATALVHEAYLQLADSAILDWQGRAHFMAIAAKAMRQILVRHARAKNAQKRNGHRSLRLNLDTLMTDEQNIGLDMIALNDALDELQRVDPRSSRIVELRFFGGLTHQETASLLQVSEKTVRRDWIAARAWLLSELNIA